MVISRWQSGLGGHHFPDVWGSLVVGWVDDEVGRGEVAARRDWSVAVGVGKHARKHDEKNREVCRSHAREEHGPTITSGPICSFFFSRHGNKRVELIAKNLSGLRAKILTVNG